MLALLAHARGDALMSMIGIGTAARGSKFDSDFRRSVVSSASRLRSVNPSGTVRRASFPPESDSVRVWHIFYHQYLARTFLRPHPSTFFIFIHTPAFPTFSLVVFRSQLLSFVSFLQYWGNNLYLVPELSRAISLRCTFSCWILSARS